MNAEKPNFLSQPVVKNVFMYRNGDPYYEARRIVINQKRVCNFETLLREVTSGIHPPFGAVRNIYTPRGGHKVDQLESLRSGEQYVAAGRERFKKLDYLEIGPRRKKTLQALPLLAKPLPQNRIMASARFLKPIKEPCPIFVVANGDVLNPAMRLLIHPRILGQFDKVLELVTEKMGLRVLGGVRSLYIYEGQQVTDGSQLESGQLYVAVGRDKFKKLPYIDLLFSKPQGMRRMKAYYLPPIYRMSKQNGTGKSMVHSSDSGDTDSKASPPALNGSSKEQLSAIVREISQARLISLRKKKSGQSMALGSTDQDDVKGKAEGKDTEDDLQNQTEEQNSSPNNKESTNGNDSPSDKTPIASDVDVLKEDPGDPAGADMQEDSNGQENSPSDVVNNAGTDEKSSVEEGTSQGHRSSDNEKEDEDSSQGEQNDQDKSAEGVEERDRRKGVNGGHDGSNDADTGEEQKERKEDSNDPEKAPADNETKEAKSSNANREEVGKDSSTNAEQSGEVSGEVSRGDDEVKSEAGLDVDKKEPDTDKEKESENN